MIANMSFSQNNKRTLSLEIIQSILDEMRCDRKVRMVLRDEDIETYLGINLAEEMQKDPSEIDQYVSDII